MKPRLHNPLQRRLLATAAIAICIVAMPLSAAPKLAVVKAVYQIDGGDEQALRALRNIHNHLLADPTAHIVVVALGPGIDFLLTGENDAGGYPFELIVQDLMDQGVKFEVCNNTLDSRHLDKSKFIAKISFIPSGFAELARLQAKEGYAYLKP